MLITHCCSHWHWAVLTLRQGFFIFSHCPASREGGGHKKLGGGTAKAVDPHWLKGCSTSYVIVLNNKTGGNWPRVGGCLDFGQQMVRNCVVHHSLCTFFHHLYYFHILFCPATLPFSQCTSFTFFPNSFPPCTVGSEWAAVWWLTPRWIKLHQQIQ